MSQSQLQSSRLEDEFQTKFTQLTNKVTSDGKNRRGSSQTAGDIMVSVMDESDYFDDENDEEELPKDWKKLWKISQQFSFSFPLYLIRYQNNTI